MYLGCHFYPFVYVEFSRIPLEKNGLHIFPCTINCQTRVTEKVEQALLKFTNAPEEIIALCSLPTELAQAA